MKLKMPVAALLLVPFGAAPALAAGEAPKDIIAAQIRTQGFACEKPSDAVRDAAASKPNSTVWTLTCEGAAYRVRLVPNMAAEVERLSDQKK